MKNLLEVNGHKASITFDPEIGKFRGEILGLTGGADFYATTVPGLLKEFRDSLATYLEVCKEEGIEPYENYSGKFNIRMSAELHQHLVVGAKAHNMSLNRWVTTKLAESG